MVFDSSTQGAEKTHEILSTREFQVMMLIAGGKSTAQVAEALCLSPKTVATYRSWILEKMGWKNSADMIHYAFRNRLIA